MGSGLLEGGAEQSLESFCVFVLFGIAPDGSRTLGKLAMVAKVLRCHVLKAPNWLAGS